MSGAVVGEDPRMYHGSLIPDDTFKKLTTAKAALLEAAVVAAYLVFVIWLSVTDDVNFSVTEKNVLLLTCQFFLWILSLILDHYYKWRHHFLRINGHFRMFKEMSWLVAIHFLLVSLWNAMILLVVGFMNLHYQEVFCVGTQFYLKRVLSYFIMCEIALLLPSILFYAWKVMRFNRLRPVNDIDRYECSSLCEPFRAHEMNYNSHGDAIASLLERQADLLFYYKAANNDLCQRLSNVSNCIREM